MIRKRFNNIGFFLGCTLLWWLVALDGWAMLVTEEKFEEMCKDDAQGARQLQTLFEDHEEEEIQEWLNTPFDNNGYTPLHFSTRQTCKEIVQLLLARGADPKITNRYGSMPLHAAAFNGNVEIARLLLEHQADPMALFSNDWTPLHVAATNGHVGVARLLLEHQANPMAETGGGNTPLHEAAGSGHLQVAMLLFQEYQANFMPESVTY